MKNHLTLAGILIISCGLFAFSQILERAQARLSPEQLALLAARKSKGWKGFLLPLLPIIAAYLLLSHFPAHQAWIAIPAMLLGFGLVARDLLTSGQRLRERGLPDEFCREVGKANLVFVGSLLLGAGLLFTAHWRLFLVPVPS